MTAASSGCEMSLGGQGDQLSSKQRAVTAKTTGEIHEKNSQLALRLAPCSLRLARLPRRSSQRKSPG